MEERDVPKKGKIKELGRNLGNWAMKNSHMNLLE
jgi:hypothetical protein